jgi:DNA-binding CsgD family transcriptional regulator
LLAASCVAAPTVELVAAATDTDADEVFERLEQAEIKGIVGIEGHRLRFEHPLLARGVYVGAATARRRAMHRRLAEVVEQPELHARHLALAARHGDLQTLESLDVAAEIARVRGAPAAAAELLELAVGLGGDTHERRIRLAGDHFGAGDSDRARALLEEIIEALDPGPLRAEALSLLGLVRLFDDSFLEAVDLWERALDEAADNLALRVPTLVIQSLTLFNTGRLAEGVRIAEDAVVNAERLGEPQLLSQALSVRVLLRFIRGDGVDVPGLQRALEIDAGEADVPSRPGLHTVVRPRLQQAMLLGWTGQLDHAHQEMRRIRQHCMNNGEEHELMYVSYYSVQIELWRGDFAEAAVIAEDSMERALQLGGDVTLGGALTMRAALAAYAGREGQARSDAGVAIAAHQRCGALMLAAWPVTVLGFLELSLGNQSAAITVLEPLLTRSDAAATEIFVAAFLPDAAEALVALDRVTEAEPLVDALERNGNRLDRPWMLAVGARCRAVLLAARGDVDAACSAVEAAMVHHDRLPMPFERARTQMLLGQLQRRQRRKEAATATLRDAVRAFEDMGTPLWADRARAELARTDVAHRGTDALTPSELRVAELAVSGMSNRDIATALFISPKTVEANLARIYRKLDIHSRTQLARRLRPIDP